MLPEQVTPEVATSRATRPGFPLDDGRLKVALMVILGLCLLRLWVMPIGSSFWVDEMATQFVVLHGANDPTLQVAPQVPASIYYVLPSLIQKWFGFSEIGYRIPSLIAFLAALLLIWKIAARLIHPAAGWLVVFLCLTLRDFNYQADDARPYALATLAVAASLWLLIRWLDRDSWTDAILFIAAAALVWRVHLVLWPVYVLFVIYAAVRVARGDTTVGWIKALAVFSILGACLIPVLIGALALNRQAAEHVVVDVPNTGDLVNQLKMGVVLGACAVAAVAARMLKWPAATRPIPWESWCLILGWWIGDPLCIFLYSVLTGHSVFLARYMDVALPGVALSGAAAASIFLPAKYWKQIAAITGICVLMFVGRWNHLSIAHHGSDWRGAARALDALAFSPEALVICPSPFIEARPPVWTPAYPISSFLYSNLLTYPFRGKRVPFPYEGSAEAGTFAAQLSEQNLANANRFAIYGGQRAVKFWREWFATRPELARMRSRELGDFGDVHVVVFERE